MRDITNEGDAMGDGKLELIEKLLAKAESTTPEEAEALTEHAERLMLKYGIDQAQVDERRRRQGQPPEEIVQERIVFTGTYARDFRELGTGIALALGAVHPLHADRGAGSILYLVGHVSDVAQVRRLTASLEVQAKVAMRAWWAEHREGYHSCSESERRRARSGFLRGFAAGAVGRLAEARRAVWEDVGDGTALVLASRRDRVDAAVDRIRTRRGRPRGVADGTAFVHGHRSGRQAHTGDSAVTQGRGADDE